mmetsp:Transcript_17235/g.31208  ORF Transcript_17235/g.31208 Transcript_17235/m.31208 type:complete len:515 (+) Transcript_17235:126-1670(+)
MKMSPNHQSSNEKRFRPLATAGHVLIALAFLQCVCLGKVTGFSPPLPSKVIFPPGSLRGKHSGRHQLRLMKGSSVDHDQSDSKDSKNVLKIYREYATRLWNETNPLARQRIAKDKAAAAVRQVEHIMIGEEYVAFSEEAEEARQQLLDACQNMLKVMDRNPDIDLSIENQISVNETAAVVETSSNNMAPAKAKPRRSILFGAAMGLVVACWVFSGNYIFTGLFTLMTILGQLEYYRMVMSTGIYPARRISIVGACSMFLTALFAPNLHQICLPMFGMYAMIWFLTMRKEVTTISEIATTFTGMFYLGYIPSFWVRTRLIGSDRAPTRLAPIMAPFLNMLGTKADKLPHFIPKAVHLPITTGAIFIFWTWLCLAFSDVGAYFVGRKFGKTKLGEIAPAAGATSPNKSVEGVIGGCTVSALLGIAGAWVQKWPYWWFVGAIHGIIIGLLGLVGDLTASMLKRNAGLKDFGDLIPEHGGILDRVDSFVFTAPYSWLMCAYIIPLLKQFALARGVLPV